MEDQSINRKKVELSFVQGQVKIGVKTPHTRLAQGTIDDTIPGSHIFVTKRRGKKSSRRMQGGKKTLSSYTRT